MSKGRWLLQIDEVCIKKRPFMRQAGRQAGRQATKLKKTIYPGFWYYHCPRAALPVTLFPL